MGGNLYAFVDILKTPQECEKLSLEKKRCEKEEMKDLYPETL